MLHYVRLAFTGLGLLVAGQAQATTLADLGLADGVTLRGPRTAIDLVFPLPGPARGAQLRLDLVPSPVLDQDSTITVLAEGQPLATLALRSGPHTVEVPVPARLTQADALAIRIAADHALRRGDPCFDNDTPAVWTRIGPASGLAVAAAEPGEPGVGAAWRMMVGRVGLALPEAPTTADLEAALTLAVALLRRGADPVLAAHDQARIHIVSDGAALRLEPGAEAWAPRLLVAGPAAARALIGAAPLLDSTGPVEARGATVPLSTPAEPDSRSFAELGLPALALDVFGTAEAALELPFDRLPADRRPEALVLFGRSGAIPAGQVLAVTVSAAGRLLWSETYRGAAVLDGVRIGLPAELLAHRMRLTLRVTRMGAERACGADDAIPFQLRPTSRIALAQGAVAPRDLAGFAVAADRPVPVRVGGPAEAARVLPVAAQLLAAAGARPGAIAVATDAPLDRPFLVIATTPPADVAESAPVRPDLGRIVLERPGEGIRVELDGAPAMTVVQLVRAGAAHGVWISPGAVPVPPAGPLELAGADVAVFTGGARPALFDTRAPEAVIEHPQMTGAEALLARWRLELFAAVWAVLTLGAIAAVVRLRRRGRE
jgi:hypothetical protein